MRTSYLTVVTLVVPTYYIAKWHGYTPVPCVHISCRATCRNWICHVKVKEWVLFTLRRATTE